MTTTTAPTGADAPATFGAIGVAGDLVDALSDAGITAPFPIQELTLPLALAGADVIGQARTGTGKTLAFGLPMLQRADTGDRATQVLIVVPTRELCIQVREDVDRAGARKGVPVVAVYGGRPIEPQAAAIAKGAPIVVGTPGRLLDLVNRGLLDLSTVTGVVLDEADEMLDLGFLPDVERLIEATATPRQTLLFSATMPSAVVALARRYMTKPTFLRADVEEIHVAPETQQHFFSCHRMDKPAVLARILKTPGRGLCVVFVRTKRMADILAKELDERGVKAAAIHSDLRQEARERAMQRFRKGTIDVLVATEVAARGLDIDDVTHVVNYDCPDDEKMYLHRIGRTGRAGASGVAITLALWNEAARMEMIKRALDITDETHEVFSTSPILDELFDLVPEVSRLRATTKDAKPGRGAGKRSGPPAAEEKPPAGRSRRRQRRDEPAAQAPASGPAEDRDPSTNGRAAAAPASHPDDEDATAPDSSSVTRRRTRTRTRRPRDERPDERPGNGTASAPSENTPAETAQRTPDDQPTDQPAEGTRARTRTRRRQTSDRPAPPAASADRTQAADEPLSTEPTDGRERNEPKTAAQPSRPTGDRNRRGGRGEGRRRSKRGGQRRGSGRSGARGASSDRRATPAEAPDRDTLRDGGRPRLRRTLDVTHLP